MSETDISEEACELHCETLFKLTLGKRMDVPARELERAVDRIRALRARVTELEQIEFFLKNDHPATYAQLMDTVKVWK